MKKFEHIYIYLQRTFLPIVFLLSLVSCRSVSNDNNDVLAHQLFEKNIELISVYTDSISNVNDSAALNRMTEGINGALVKIVYQFPPNTDLSLTEEENDSIIHMLDRLAKLIKLKRKSVLISPDSLQTDSIQLNP